MLYDTHQLETGGEVWACSWANYHVAATHRVLAGHVWVVCPCFPWAVRAGCSGWHQSPHTHQRHHHTLRGLDNHVLSHYHIVREGREWERVSHMTLNYYGAVQTRQYIGVRAGPAGPVLAGPLFQWFNEIYYKYIQKLRAHFAQAYYSRTTSKVLPTLLQYGICNIINYIIHKNAVEGTRSAMCVASFPCSPHLHDPP